MRSTGRTTRGVWIASGVALLIGLAGLTLSMGGASPVAATLEPGVRVASLPATPPEEAEAVFDGEGLRAHGDLREAPAEAAPVAELADGPGDALLAGLDDVGDPSTARARRAVGPSVTTPAGSAGSTGYGYGTLSAPAAIAAPAPVPTRGVLASTFVSGGGAAAHLEDLMDRGVMVDGENIRLGALGALGRLPYAVPGSEAVALHAELERTRLLEGGERVHLQIALLAREGERPVRPHMDVRLVLDRSGSMAGTGWEHAVRAAHALVDRLEAGDTFGLVSYSDDATVDLEPARVGNRRAAHAAIDRLAPGGGTNIEAAMRSVAASPPRHHDASDVALVVLVSDGQATVGHTTASELSPIAREMFDATGALTTTIGLGTSFDEDVMLSIAREGSGSYHFVRRAEDVGTILEDELDERALAVAQDLRLRVRLAPGVTVHRVYGSRVLSEAEEASVRRTEVAVDERLARELGVTRDREEDVDDGLRMHIPSFRRGDQHVVLFELDVPAGMGTSDVAEVFLDYKDLRTAENETASVEVTAERTGDAEAAMASVRRPVKRTVLAFQAADALQSAAAALDGYDVAGARTILEERVTLLRAAADLWNDEALLRDATLLSRYSRVIEGAYGGFGAGERRTLAMAMAYYGDERMN